LLARTEFSELVPGRVKVKSLERFEIRHLFVPGGGTNEQVRSLFEIYDCTYSWMGSRDLTFKQELDAATQGRLRLFPFQPADSKMHQVDYYLSCLQVESVPRMPHIALMPDAEQSAEVYWRKNSLSTNPVLAIAPGSGAQEKNWPVVSFQAILGPVEEERGGYESLCSHGMTIAGIGLGRLAATIARCSLFIGNDSGLSHIAAALGVPTAAIFGPSDVNQWAPRGETVLILRRELHCSPCAVPAMKNCLHHDCLTALTSAEVIRQLECWPPLLTLTRRGPGIRVSAEILPDLMGG
jgi:ADP-heptose:LPS heptosyltransferase